MEKFKIENDVIETDSFNTLETELIEKEVEMGYFDNYLFEGVGENKHFVGSCTRISYCSCNCHDCTLITSDARIKKDIQGNVLGLSFINKLRPVTYHFNKDAVSHLKNGAEDLNNISMDEYKNDKLQSGFIAQEVEQVAHEIGFDFNGIVSPTNENELYALRYSNFVVPLVKAVQELNEKNENLLRKVERQNTIIEKLQNQIHELMTENSMA